MKSVSLGYRYVLAVKTNGELWGWGAGGALGDGQINAVNSPKKIMDGVNSVSAGYDHSLILKDDGTLLSCGRNYNGQLGDGNSETNNWTLTPSPVNLGSVKTIEEKKTYIVTFDPNGGDVDTKTITVTCGDEYGELPVPTRTGYTFEGWFTDDNVQIKDDTEVTITAPQTLHAHWKANIYTITYDSNGGTGITADSVHIYDSERALTKNGFTKGNYAFMGWNTDPDGNGEFYADEAVVKNLASEDGSAVILYAQWERVGTKTTIEDRGEYTIVNVKITVVEPPCLIILSAYSDGCLAAVETRAYTSSDESFSIESDFDAVKVMLWNGLDRMDPISKVEIVEKY